MRAFAVTIKDRFSKNKKAWFASLVAALVFLYGFLLLFPARAKLKEVSRELRKNQEAIQEIYLAVQGSHHMAEGLLRMQEELDWLRELLPDNENVSGLIRLFSSEAQERKIQVLSITPQPAIQLQSLGEGAASGRWIGFAVPIQVRMQGRYTDIGEFLAGLNSLPRLTRVEAISLKRDRSIEPLLQAECDFLTYYLLEQPRNGP